MSEEIFNPLHALVHQTFEKSMKRDLEENYLKQTGHVTKWSLFCDFCFDDQNKPNDVFSVTLIPHIDIPEELEKYINAIAKVDIKKTRHVSNDFINFLKEYPLISFSFIMSDRKEIFGINDDEIVESLKQTFEEIKKQYQTWTLNQPEQKEMYSEMIRKVNCVLQLVKQRKKVKQIVDMLLITHIGAYIASRVVNPANLKVFGWFSDRDAINEVCDHVSTDLFFYYLFGFLNGIDFIMVSAKARSVDEPFYDAFVRLPDYMAGTLADYDFEKGVISKDKFDIMLTNYMAENVFNNFVLKIGMQDSSMSCGRITIHKKAEQKEEIE